MAADAYDVASIKLATNKTIGRFGVLPGGQLALGNRTLRDIIAFAYGVNCHGDSCLHLVLGGPAWLDSLRFEILAKPAQPDPPMLSLARLEAAKPRVRVLLAERFQLRVRAEDKEMRVYALRVAKGGANPRRDR